LKYQGATTIKFREAIQSDFEYIAENSMSRGIQKLCPEQADYTYTLEHEDVVLGIGGFRMINLHTAWCWVDLGPAGHENGLATYRVIKGWIKSFSEDKGLKRLQAYVECDFPEAIRMVQCLGFKKESIMENFMGDKDAFMYARTV
jgi:RimJ/RimL family protein N-acetyltransferase